MKNEKYVELVISIRALLDSESDVIAALANVCSAIHFKFGFWWTGFYLVKNNELIVGPFQGPVACSKIQYGKGVCGKAWESSATILVDNVHEFEGHIACSAESNSEIVVPLIANSEVVGVLDIDSKEYASFNIVDQQYLEEIASLITQKFWN